MPNQLDVEVLGRGKQSVLRANGVATCLVQYIDDDLSITSLKGRNDVGQFLARRDRLEERRKLILGKRAASQAS